MPNWATNQLTLYSRDPGLLGAVREALSGVDASGDASALTFTTLLPLEGGWDADSADERWGTKWDAHDVDVTTEATTLAYRFNTAWSPPIPWVEELSRHWPDLVVFHSFTEESNAFLGAVWWSAGRAVLQNVESGAEVAARYCCPSCGGDGSDPDDCDEGCEDARVELPEWMGFQDAIAAEFAPDGPTPVASTR